MQARMIIAYGAGPSQASQSSPLGTGTLLGRLFAPKLRFDTQCTSLTSPSVPLQMYSQIRRIESLEWPWLPICVGALRCAATSRSLRAS